jgi:DNA-binding MarR family transcriptional regulator
VTTPRKPRPLVVECTQVLHHLADQTQPQRGVWSELDLTMIQLKALFALKAQGFMPVGQLARMLAISEPAASMLVGRLEGSGLALRESDPQDRRRTRVVPTAKAIELAEHLLRVKEERMVQWLDEMTDADLRALAQGTRALVAAINSFSAKAQEQKERS